MTAACPALQLPATPAPPRPRAARRERTLSPPAARREAGTGLRGRPAPGARAAILSAGRAAGFAAMAAKGGDGEARPRPAARGGRGGAGGTGGKRPLGAGQARFPAAPRARPAGAGAHVSPRFPGNTGRAAGGAVPRL